MIFDLRADHPILKRIDCHDLTHVGVELLKKSLISLNYENIVIERNENFVIDSESTFEVMIETPHKFVVIGFLNSIANIRNFDYFEGFLIRPIYSLSDPIDPKKAICRKFIMKSLKGK